MIPRVTFVEPSMGSTMMRYCGVEDVVKGGRSSVTISKPWPLSINPSAANLTGHRGSHATATEAVENKIVLFRRSQDDTFKQGRRFLGRIAIALRIFLMQMADIAPNIGGSH